MDYKLELYYFPQCPFCVRVLQVIEQLNLKKIELNNIIEVPAHREKLINDTGRSTVPCLYINDKPMFESADIVTWLQDHKSELN